MLSRLAWRAIARLGCSTVPPQGVSPRSSVICSYSRFFTSQLHQQPIIASNMMQCSNIMHRNPWNSINGQPIGIASIPTLESQQIRRFHAKGSKVRYMDFRYKFNTSHYRSHLIIIRRQKMKKHRRLKWRKKFKCLLAKKRLKREIAKEKTFRVELLTMIKKAEQFDPREYALRKINEANNVKREKTKEERLEELKELIRINRYQVDYIKPKHKRIQTLSDYR